MTSLLRAIFCCLGKRVTDPNLPDERTRLINPSDIEARASIGDRREIYERNALDSARFDDRLQDIVQSAEGKMVNVNSPFPFNLYNRPPAVLDALVHANPHFFTPASRSASVSTKAYTRLKSNRPSALRLHPALEISSLTPTSGAFPLSRSRSASISRSPYRSTSPSESFKREGDPSDTQSVQPAVLGVRLVRRTTSKRNGSVTTAATAGMRGRTTVKKGTEDLTPLATISLADPEADFMACDTQPGDVRDEIVPHHNDLSRNLPDGVSGRRSPKPVLSDSSEAPNMFSFVLQDVGILCASWED